MPPLDPSGLSFTPFRWQLCCALALFASGPGASADAVTAAPPNIVLIYADDLGYGDVGAYGATAIPTPNIDRLAREGLRFTSGYAPSATCTPSRYAVLTGEYAWRREAARVLPGDAALIIDPGRTTLPSVLRRAGYRTGIVGKWHLGLGDGRPIDWNGAITPGPLEVGFDQSFILPATGDRVPCVFIDGHRVAGLDPADPITVSYSAPIPGEPTGAANPELLRVFPSHGHDMTIVNGISRIGYMKGGRAALWHDEDLADVLVQRSVAFLKESPGRPFFLFMALHDPHVPRVPHPRFVGKTRLGPRGDAIVQVDWCVGEILGTLDRIGAARDTLVIFTSDNGPVLNDGYQDDAVRRLGGHTPAGPFRGGKYSLFEAGCRVPFILRWPARIRPGVSDAMVSQVDLLASLAALAGARLEPEEGPDSFDLSVAFLGESPIGRDHLVLHAPGGTPLLQGRWKYIAPNDRIPVHRTTAIELGNAPAPQLYDLEADPGERLNLASKHPDRVREFVTRLEAIRSSERTRPLAAEEAPAQTRADR